MRKHSGWFPYNPRGDPNAHDLTRSGGSGRVVGIGAICDFAAGEPEPESSQRQSFSIQEFVELEDGHRVVVDHRGWTTSSVRALVELENGQRMVLENVVPIRTGWTPNSIRQQVLNVVLPDDDAEASKEAHPWSHLAQQANAQGIEVTADELKTLHYDVILTQRLVRWLEAPQSGEQIEE